MFSVSGGRREEKSFQQFSLAVRFLVDSKWTQSIGQKDALIPAIREVLCRNRRG